MYCHVFAAPYKHLYIFTWQIPVILRVNRAYRVKCEWSESCSVMSNSLWPQGLYWNSVGQNTAVDSLSLLWGIFPTQVSCIVGWFFTSWATGNSKNTGVGSLSLFQGIFPTQELNQGLLHCRRILCQLSYQGSPCRVNRRVNKIQSLHF